MLTKDEENALDAVSLKAEHDSKFIRILLSQLYKDDLSMLSFRTFTGRSKLQKNLINDNTSDQIKPISPAKKIQIINRFKQRIMNASITNQEKFKRLQSSNVTRLIATGIGNLRRQQKVPHNGTVD